MLRSLFSFLLANNLIELSWQLFLWTALGGAAGLLVGIGAFWAIRSLGGYRLEARGARWWRGLVCALDVLVLTVAGLYIGAFEGAWRGLEDTAGKSTLVQELNGKVGRVEAAFLAGIYHASALLRDQPQISPAEATRTVNDRLDAFLVGKEEIPVQDFQRQINNAGRQVIDQVAGVAEQRALAWLPALRGNLGQRLLRMGLGELGEGLLHEQARKGLRRIRLDAHLDRILATLPAEAAREGASDALSFPELAAPFQREGVMPWVLDAVRGFVRSHQLLAALLAAGALLVPVLGFRIARKPQMGSLET